MVNCCRAGLYKQLATLKGLVEEYREQPQANQTLRGPIVENLAQTGLDQDCPFRPAPADQGRTSNGSHGCQTSNAEPELLSAESVESVSEGDFTEYIGRVYQYLQVTNPYNINLCDLCHADVHKPAQISGQHTYNWECHYLQG